MDISPAHYTKLDTQIKLMEAVNSVMKAPIYIAIIDSLKELKAIKTKQQVFKMHIPTGNIGKFLKETNPTGKPITTVIELQDGNIYFAPSTEFQDV